MTRLVLASSNRGKLDELRELLSPAGHELVAQSDLGVDDAEETGGTFVENALLKARHATRITGLPTLADDSGLLVDALDGAPGLRSARYSGEHGNAAANNALLLERMCDVAGEARRAHFYCVLVLLRSADDPQPLIAEGSWHGSILEAPRGAQGFGYDPLFLPDESAQRAAELDPATKNRISHRGQALAALRERLARIVSRCSCNLGIRRAGPDMAQPSRRCTAPTAIACDRCSANTQACLAPNRSGAAIGPFRYLSIDRCLPRNPRRSLRCVPRNARSKRYAQIDARGDALRPSTQRRASAATHRG